MSTGNFSWAFNQLKLDTLVRRVGWEAGDYLYYRGDHDCIYYWWAAGSSAERWVPSQSALLAGDWEKMLEPTVGPILLIHTMTAHTPEGKAMMDVVLANGGSIEPCDPGKVCCYHCKQVACAGRCMGGA